MRPKTLDTSRHARLLADLTDHARADDRIRAAWLEGSFATGTADAGSDLDFHVAVTAEAFDTFREEAANWIAQTRDVVGMVPVPLGTRQLLACSLADATRLDLFIERASLIAEPLRPVEPRIIFDHDALLEDARVDPAVALSPLPRLREVMNTFRFGFTFPARLSAREEWGSLHLNALLVVFQFLVPALLAVRHPEHTFRPQLHNERFLDDDHRAQVDSIVAELARAFSELPPDLEAVRRAYSHLLSALLAAFAAAAEAHEVDWPPEVDATIRAYLRAELDLNLDL